MPVGDRRNSQASSRRHSFKKILIITLELALGEHCLGDVIILKNGKQIRVERSWAEGNKIQYELNGNIYGFSKSLVERVEKGAYFPEAADTKAETSKPLKPVPLDVQQGLNVESLQPSRKVSDIIIDGKLNQQ